MTERPAALVRAVPRTFSSALARAPVAPPLSARRAAKQHAEYVAALQGGGYRVETIDADDRHPDCCFVEDAAIVIGDHALVARAGHQSRRGEGHVVAPLLEPFVRVHHARAPATIDGGDVLVCGNRVFVGISQRTNPEGAAAVAALAEPQGMIVTTVAVGSVLHLKSGLSAVDDHTVLWHPRACDRRELLGLTVVEVPGDDPAAANVVRLPDGRLLVPDAHGPTGRLVESLGFEAVGVDISEFSRADGGLTCLSIRLR